MVAVTEIKAAHSGTGRAPAAARGARRGVIRSFYARAALIVLLPVLMVQLAVAVSFLQRHYEDVTDQMTENMVPAIALARRDPAAGAAFRIDPAPPPPVTRIRWYDLSARAMRARLEQAFPDIATLDIVSRRKTVQLGFADGSGLALPRSAVSASNPHQLLVLMVGVGLVMTLISMLFMRGQIRPIRRLADAAEAFGKGRSVPYRPTGATEVRQAGAAFLEMRARIERHIEQRTLLLSGVSHDLRTPLTRMKLELEMMEGPEAAALRGDVAAMERIIDTFIGFARGDATARWEEVDLLALVRRAARDALPDRAVAVAGPEAGHGAGTEAREAVTRRVAPTTLERAVANLLHNAARYGSRIEARVIASTHAVVLRVDDDGPGIPEADREAATRPFARLDGARTNTAGNVGLGLAIVQDVARAHGGSLRLSRSDMGGLRAEIVLPR